ncbi:MAG: 30S ribosomal protein S6 [Dehalococcoidia bacterium]|nr:30S ribosomal protein S6 [Dehalococcoidia bacterium]
MREYELVYIISPRVEEESLAGVVEKVNQFIANRGGQVDSVDSWGKRRLAYPIGAFREGAYFLARFKLDQAQASDLENSLRTTEEIIRHLVVRLEPGQARRPQQPQQTQQPQVQEQQPQETQLSEQPQQAQLEEQQTQAQEQQPQET